MTTRRALLALGALWPFGRSALAQPAPDRRPDHVSRPRIGESYWCVLQPYDAQSRRVEVRLPWRGTWRHGVWGDELVYSADPHVAVKPSPRYLFTTEDAARLAIAWDWNHPPKSARTAIVLAPHTLQSIRAAFGRARQSSSFADGAVPGLMAVDLDRASAQQLFAALAVSLDAQAYPQVERDEPPR